MLEKLVAILVISFATSIVCDASVAANDFGRAKCQTMIGWEAELARHGVGLNCR